MLVALAACALLGYRARAAAQELVVVESSQADRASADKLQELVREPFTRAMTPPASAAPSSAACRSQARVELVLDTAQHSVRLIRCRDGTVLSRSLDPDAARRTPYLGAFVAAELLALNDELESAHAHAAQGTEPAPALHEVPASPAASASLRVVPAEPRLWLRAGAELSAWGAPFAAVLRPNLGVGANLGSAFAVGSSWLLELCLAPFATATLRRAGESLALQRHDVQLRFGARFALGRLRVAGFALLRGSLSHARYTALQPTSATQLRSGVGTGIAVSLALTRGFALYTQLVLDVAASRSDYRVAGVSWTRDPASQLWIGLGIALLR